MRRGRRSRSRALVVLAGAASVSFGCLERGPYREQSTARDSDQSAQDSPVAEVARLDPRGDREAGATISVRLEAEPSHLNPLLAGDGLALRVALGNIYEGLLCRDGPFAEPSPCLASRFEHDESATRWRFHLRPGVTFHDGSAVRGTDVQRTILAVATGEVPTPLTAELDDLVSSRLSVEDGHEVLELRFGGARLDRLGTFVRVPIVPASALSGELSLLVAAPFSRAPVGTGPLRFGRWVAGTSIELRRFEGYWGTPSAAAVIDYRIVRSRERAYAMLRNGRLDLASQLPVADALDVGALSATLEPFSYAQPAYLAAVYNTRRSPMSTPSERRALTMLLDREAVIDALLAGRGAPISGPYFGAEADPSLAPLPFDRHAAARALRERPRVGLIYPLESRTMARIADIWAADADGIATLVPTPLPFATVLERARSGEFDIVLLAFTSGPELDMFSRLHSSQVGGENYGGLLDATMDERLQAVRAATSRADIVAATRRAHRRIAELAPYAFIASDVRAGLVAYDVGGIAPQSEPLARRLWRLRGSR